MKPGFSALLLLLLCITGAVSLSAEEFDFDVESFEKDPFEWSGYTEFRYEHSKLNDAAALYPLNYPTGRGNLNRWVGTLELAGDYHWDETRLSGRWNGSGQDDESTTLMDGSLYELYLIHRFDKSLTVEVGKRALKWGKGYAWNPVAFIERAKDPSDPDLSREGFTLAQLDWVKSLSGDIKTIAFSAVALPVSNELNTSFGQKNSINVAAKLYMLIYDIDVDLYYLNNGARPGRIGADFSMNLASNFELHGEWAYIPDYPRKVLENNLLVQRHSNSHAWLIGMRYLTEQDTTWIAEYYYQDHGYSSAEIRSYYDLLTNSVNPVAVRDMGQQAGFLRINPMRDYIYLRVSQKEPFDWLYTSFAATAIYNAQDHSATVIPEFVYTGFDNSELRLRMNYLLGKQPSEYGEKLAAYKLEMRMRYFF